MRQRLGELFAVVAVGLSFVNTFLSAASKDYDDSTVFALAAVLALAGIVFAIGDAGPDRPT